MKCLGKQGDAILRWYWEQLQLGGGSYVRYQIAWEHVGTVKGKKFRKQMRTLLRRTSDNRGLETAMKKCREQDGWSRRADPSGAEDVQKTGDLFHSSA